ncbi:MAG: FMN-binding negative transcriptional regulator [Bacteroidota bacterium]|nr:FMN-binding negative transcriptional regulator [Bacteroidota bacterium]
MYNVPHFKANENKEIIDFMKAHPFVIICGISEKNEPVATHVPVILKEEEAAIVLHMHTKRKQDHTLAFSANRNVLVIFNGAHSYVSASWYQQQQTASTWNYKAVHAKGIVEEMDDDELHRLLIELTDHFEENPHSPASVKNMDPVYVQQQMKAIVGYKIRLTAIQHVFKLSQNRDEKSYENIILHLEAGNAEQRIIAEEMKTNKNQLFK